MCCFILTHSSMNCECPLRAIREFKNSFKSMYTQIKDNGIHITGQTVEPHGHGYCSSFNRKPVEF